MSDIRKLLNAEGAEGAQKSQKEPMENDFSREIIGASVEVQRVLGTGLLESSYMAALKVELKERGLAFQSEVPIEGRYKNATLGIAHRADLIVEDCVIVEVKAVEATTENHRAQLLSYLRLSGLKLGLLINFHVSPIVKGVHRLVNKL